MTNGTVVERNLSMVWQLPVALAFLDHSFRIARVSEKWLHHFRISSDDVIGLDFRSITQSEEERFEEVLLNCLSGNKGTISVHRTENHNKKYFDYHFTPWYDDTKKEVIGVIVQVEDTTDHVNLNSNFHRLESVLKQKSEIGKIGSWELDLKTNLMSWSAMTKTVFEVDKEYRPNIENTIQFFKRGYNQNKISMLFHDALIKGSPFSEKLEIQSSKKQTKWVLIAGRVSVKNEQRKLIGIIQDISEQILFENKAQENYRLLQTLIDNLPINVYIKDKMSRKILANKAECDFLGLPDQQRVLGKTDIDFLCESSAEQSRKEDIGVFKTNTPMLNKEKTSIKKDGTTTHFLSSKIPLPNSNGETDSLLGISVDITKLKLKEDELKHLINITSVQNKKLLNFAHIVSHNLRSYTANFTMLLDFLVNEEDAEERKRIIEMLVSSSEGLSETLSNLNEVISIRDKVNTKKQPINLYAQLEKLLDNLNPMVTKHDATIINKVPKKIVVNAIEDYVDNIITNLITNAIRYRHPNRLPKIIIDVEIKGNQICLSVEDNGLGIDMVKHGRKLFGMYKTFHNHGDSKGIGLFINKNQAEAMGCDLMAESEVDKGSIFTIVFNE